MKRFYNIIFPLIFPLMVAAQNPIPNAGFENWSGGEPDGWFTINIPGTPAITQTSGSHSGSSALLGTVVNVAGLPFGPAATTGTLQDPNFPVSQKYARLTGYYQFNPVGTDILTLSVIMSKGGLPIGGEAIQIQTATSNWTPFSIDIVYSNQEVPDAASISTSLTATGLLNFGSTFHLDDLQFEGTVGIEDDERNTRINTFALNNNYPNPFNPSTNFSFTLPKRGDVQLSVFNSLGQEVARVIQQKMSAGKHSVEWHAIDLPSGVYYYQLTAGKNTAIKKLILMK